MSFFLENNKYNVCKCSLLLLIVTISFQIILKLRDFILAFLDFVLKLIQLNHFGAQSHASRCSLGEVFGTI